MNTLYKSYPSNNKIKDVKDSTMARMIGTMIILALVLAYGVLSEREPVTQCYATHEELTQCY